MSGQWEVVGKRKEKPSLKAKPATTTTAKEKLDQKLTINVEEVLPMSQLQELYSEKKKLPKAQQQDGKQTKVKETKSQSKTKNTAISKTKHFKSIELAINAVKIDDFKSVYANNKVVYPTMPLVWLHELANYLNVHALVAKHDIDFVNKPDNYPLSVMPSALRAVLESALSQAGQDVAARFFDLCLVSMANDMNKNAPVLGYKLCIQLLAQTCPTFCLRDVAKFKALRNSYQNRPNIGISILWALGQGGFHDWHVGYKAFNEYMLLMCSMKHYTNFVVMYLTCLIKKHECSAGLITLDEYVSIVQFSEMQKKNLSRVIEAELLQTIAICNSLLVLEEPQRCFVQLLPVMRKMSCKENRKHVCRLLKQCLHLDEKSFYVWDSLYKTQMLESALLLQYIERDWSSVSKEIKVEVLRITLKSFAAVNVQYRASSNAHFDGLDECVNAIKKLNNKMAESKKKTRSKSRFIVYIVGFLLAAFIYIDVRQNGGWNHSRTSQALNSTGVYGYTNKAYDYGAECTRWMHNRIELAFPGITQTTVQFTTPYIELGRDLGLVLSKVAMNAKERVLEQVPRVAKIIDTYAPGIIEQMQAFGVKVWSTSVLYFENGRDYLMTNVFVGRLAPEQIQKTVLLAFQDSVDMVQEGSKWLYSKAMTFVN